MPRRLAIPPVCQFLGYSLVGVAVPLLDTVYYRVPKLRQRVPRMGDRDRGGVGHRAREQKTGTNVSVPWRYSADIEAGRLRNDSRVDCRGAQSGADARGARHHRRVVCHVPVLHGVTPCHGNAGRESGRSEHTSVFITRDGPQAHAPWSKSVYESNWFSIERACAPYTTSG